MIAMNALVLFCLLPLAYAGWKDYKTMTCPNWVPLLIFVVGALNLYCGGGNLIAACYVSLAALVLYGLNLIGGADCKIVMALSLVCGMWSVYVLLGALAAVLVVMAIQKKMPKDVPMLTFIFSAYLLLCMAIFFGIVQL